MDDRWMTVKEVAKYLQLSNDQIYHLAQKGRTPVSKVGARWRFNKEKIDQWMERQGVKAHKPKSRVDL
jgi:excisionase family DNA binding protein